MNHHMNGISPFSTSSNAGSSMNQGMSFINSKRGGAQVGGGGMRGGPMPELGMLHDAYGRHHASHATPQMHALPPFGVGAMPMQHQPPSQVPQPPHPHAHPHAHAHVHPHPHPHPHAHAHAHAHPHSLSHPHPHHHQQLQQQPPQQPPPPQPQPQQYFSSQPQESYHVEASFDYNGIDSAKIESIKRTLAALQDISQGRQAVDWDAIVDPACPAESAARIERALSLPTATADNLSSVASRISTPDYIQIVAHLKDGWKGKVRDAVLQNVLQTLTTAEEEPMPVCSEMLAKMVKLNLVVMRGAATTVNTLLREPNTRRAAIAVLGRLAEAARGDEALMRALQLVEQTLYSISDREYEYDILAISRLMRWRDADRRSALVSFNKLNPPLSATLSQPLKSAVMKLASAAGGSGGVFVVSMAYFPMRDELVTGSSDGAIVIWGGADSATGEVRPATSFSMPYDCVPVAMESVDDGATLVIIGVPKPGTTDVGRQMFGKRSVSDDPSKTASSASNPKAGSSARKQGSLDGAVEEMPSDGLRAAVIHMRHYSDVHGTWSAGETIVRKDNHVITVVKALNCNSISFCVAESHPLSAEALGAHNGCVPGAVGRIASPAWQHDLVFFSTQGFQEVLRMTGVHSDFVTTIAVSADNDGLILTGSRDASIKLWDLRATSSGSVPTSKGGRGAVGKAASSMVEEVSAQPVHHITTSHTDTITAIVAYRNVIVSASLDGTMIVWDPRKMASPLNQRSFDGPVLSVVGVCGVEGAVGMAAGATIANGHCTRVAVSTPRALSLVSLDTLACEHIIPNACYSLLQSNFNGGVLMAASEVAGGVELYAVTN